jgi:hypothetical protein
MNKRKVSFSTSTETLLQTLGHIKGAIPDARSIAMTTVCEITITNKMATFAVPGAIFSMECNTYGTCKAVVSFMHLFLIVKDVKCKKTEIVIIDSDLIINNISIAAKTTFFEKDNILRTIQLPINYTLVHLLGLENDGYTKEEIEFNNLKPIINAAEKSLHINLLKAYHKLAIYGVSYCELESFVNSKLFPVTKCTAKIVDENKSITQVVAIRKFFEKLDIEMIETFLDNDKTYQNFKKPEFIDKLSNVFKKLKDLGDTFLKSMEGECIGCSPGKKGYTFIGDRSGKYLSFIFDIANDTIKDIYECRRFVTKDTKLDYNNRLYIDEGISQSM